MDSMFRCFACHEMIFSNAGTCRFCGAGFDAEAAWAAAQQQTNVTHACSLANNMKMAWFIAPAFVAAQAYFVFGPYIIPKLWFIVQAAPPGAAIGSIIWLRQYGSLPTSDPDFPAARQVVKRTLYIWLATFIIQLLLLGIFVFQRLNDVP